MDACPQAFGFGPNPSLIDNPHIVTLLTTELAADRPVYFHFGNIVDFGHSTVIDGIRKEGNRHLVHINFGAQEADLTKWYDLFAPVSQPDDVTLPAFVTIRPRLKAPDADTHSIPATPNRDSCG